MTETTTAPAEEWGEVERAADAAYPERPDNPHNHLYTISLDGRGPMVVVRADSAEEINARFQDLESAGTMTMLASVYSHLKAEMLVAQGLGPVTPVAAPQGQPTAAQQVQQAYPAPGVVPALPPANQPYPGQPAWQQAGASAVPAPPQVNVPPNWFKLNVPFKQKGQFDAIVAQYSIRKDDPARGGQVSFQKAVKSWYCSPEVVGAFAQFSPIPAAAA